MISKKSQANLPCFFYLLKLHRILHLINNSNRQATNSLHCILIESGSLLFLIHGVKLCTTFFLACKSPTHIASLYKMPSMLIEQSILKFL